MDSTLKMHYNRNSGLLQWWEELVAEENIGIPLL